MIEHLSTHTYAIIVPWLKFVVVLFQTKKYLMYSCHVFMDMSWTWWTMIICKLNTDSGLWKSHSHFSATNSWSTHAAVAYCNQYGLRHTPLISIEGTCNIPKRNCLQIFWNQIWGWDWWFSSCASPCTSKVYWSPWRRQTRFSVQRWWVLGEVKYRQFCCFSISQGRLYRMFTLALAWDMPCFLSCTWYPSCKQICKKQQPKQLQRMMPRRPWPWPLEGGSRQDVATLKPNLWCWTHAFIIVYMPCFHPFIDWCYTWCGEKGVYWFVEDSVRLAS